MPPAPCTGPSADRPLRASARGARRRPSAGLRVLVVALSLVRCSSGGGGPGEVEFAASPTAAAPNLVRLTGETIADDTVRVHVVIDGPTTDDDLYTFAFDLVLGDPDVAQLVGGSVSFGDALVPQAPQLPLALASQIGDRIVVGVSLSNGGSGGAVGAGTYPVVSFDLRVDGKGTTSLAFDGSPLNPIDPTADPAVLDSAGMLVGSVVFDSVPAVVSR